MAVSKYTLASLADQTSINKQNGPGWVPSAASEKFEKYAKAINGCAFTALAGLVILFICMTVLEFTHARACVIPMGIGGGLFILGLAGVGGCFYKVMHKKLSNQELLNFIGPAGQNAISDFNRQIDEYANTPEGRGLNFETTKSKYAERVALIWQDLFDEQPETL